MLLQIQSFVSQCISDTDTRKSMPNTLLQHFAIGSGHKIVIRYPMGWPLIANHAQYTHWMNCIFLQIILNQLYCKLSLSQIPYLRSHFRQRFSSITLRIRSGLAHSIPATVAEAVSNSHALFFTRPSHIELWPSHHQYRHDPASTAAEILAAHEDFAPSQTMPKRWQARSRPCGRSHQYLRPADTRCPSLRPHRTTRRAEGGNAAIPFLVDRNKV